MTTKPSVTAMLYAGATEARPRATTASRPTESLRRPFPCGLVWRSDWGVGSGVMDGHGALLGLEVIH